MIPTDDFDTLTPTAHDHGHDTLFGRHQYDQRLIELERKIDKLTSDVEDLVNAWRAASWLVGAVKWFGGVATAITAVYVLFKGFGK